MVRGFRRGTRASLACPFALMEDSEYPPDRKKTSAGCKDIASQGGKRKLHRTISSTMVSVHLTTTTTTIQRKKAPM